MAERHLLSEFIKKQKEDKKESPERCRTHMKKHQFTNFCRFDQHIGKTDFFNGIFNHQSENQHDSGKDDGTEKFFPQIKIEMRYCIFFISFVCHLTR